MFEMSQPRGLSRLFGPNTKEPSRGKKETQVPKEAPRSTRKPPKEEGKGDSEPKLSDKVDCNGTEKTNSTKKEDAAKLLEILGGDEAGDSEPEVKKEPEPRRELPRRNKKPSPTPPPKRTERELPRKTRSTVEDKDLVKKDVKSPKKEVKTPKRKAPEEEKPTTSKKLASETERRNSGSSEEEKTRRGQNGEGKGKKTSTEESKKGVSTDELKPKKSTTSDEKSKKASAEDVKSKKTVTIDDGRSDRSNSPSKDGDTPVRVSARLQTTKRKFSVKELFSKPTSPDDEKKEDKEKEKPREPSPVPAPEKKQRRDSGDKPQPKTPKPLQKSLKPASEGPPSKKDIKPKKSEDNNDKSEEEKTKGDVKRERETVSLGPEVTLTRVGKSAQEAQESENPSPPKKAPTILKKGNLSPRPAEKKEVKEVVRVEPAPTSTAASSKIFVKEDIFIKQEPLTDVPPAVIAPVKREMKGLVDIFGRVKSPPKKSIKLSTLVTRDCDGEVVVKNIEVLGKDDTQTVIQKGVVKRPSSSAQTNSSDESFDKFFLTKSRVVEHNDSFESDSGEDGQFPEEQSIENPQREEIVGGDIMEEGGSATIYDLMQTISEYLPAWNLHILEDSTFCIAHVARGPLGIPVMKKIIELDSDYNAKVFVEENQVDDFQGVYNTYDGIRSLIEAVDKL